MNGTYITANLLQTVSVWGRVYGVCMRDCMHVCVFLSDFYILYHSWF